MITVTSDICAFFPRETVWKWHIHWYSLTENLPFHYSSLSLSRTLSPIFVLENNKQWITGNRKEPINHQVVLQSVENGTKKNKINGFNSGTKSKLRVWLMWCLTLQSREWIRQIGQFKTTRTKKTTQSRVNNFRFTFICCDLIYVMHRLLLVKLTEKYKTNKQTKTFLRGIFQIPKEFDLNHKTHFHTRGRNFHTFLHFPSCPVGATNENHLHTWKRWKRSSLRQQPNRMKAGRTKEKNRERRHVEASFREKVRRSVFLPK